MPPRQQSPLHYVMSTVPFSTAKPTASRVVHYDKKTARILGGTIVARHAGEMIGELTLAITAKQRDRHAFCVFIHTLSNPGRSAA